MELIKAEILLISFEHIYMTYTQKLEIPGFSYRLIYLLQKPQWPLCFPHKAFSTKPTLFNFGCQHQFAAVEKLDFTECLLLK